MSNLHGFTSPLRVGAITLFAVFVVLPMARTSTTAAAEDPEVAGEKPKATDVEAPKPAKESPDRATDAPPEKKNNLQRLSKEDEVWVDLKRGLVVVGGHVCLREGMLEMFACPRQTKEHESIVSVHSKAYLVHAALLAVGAQIGHAARFEPVYTPAAGTEIEILMLWVDKDGKRRKTRAQEWIRNVKTQKAMTHPWVFAGSGFWVDPETKKRFYHAESGDLICVSNFSTATLDIPVESTQANQELLFEPFTDRIPPIDTKVRMILIPKFPKDEQEPATPAKK